MQPTHPLRIALICSILFLSQASKADENGKMILTPTNCQASTFSSIQKICSLVDKLGASCKITADSCAQASQEIFTGGTIELATPTNIKPWSGMGGLGPHYSAATNCLLRDIADMPGQKFTTSAPASTFLGDVTAQQEIGFLSFDKTTGVFEGYHRMKACGPAVGCLDAYTQKFRLTPVKTTKKGSGKKAGGYDVYEVQALDLWADGLAQGIQVALPGIMVPTPIGDIEAKPEFRFGRATGFVVAPFDGNYKSSAADPKLGITTNKTYEVYGRTAGTDALNLIPVGEHGIANPQGWISQIALGSRDADPKNPVWKPAPGVEFPVRPDANMKVARSKAEKTPNAYLGASVQVTYSPIDLIPKPLRDIGCSGIVRLCFDELDIFARPTIDVGYMSQINFFHNEQSRWNGKQVGGGTIPQPDWTPANVDQSKTMSVFAASATAARFALDAGLNFVIRLEINTFFTKIKKNIVDIHPRTTIAEKIDKGYSKMPAAFAQSQATKIVSDKKFFQNYTTFNGTNLASGTADGGLNHIKACLAKATPPGSMPAEPTYTPGDLTVLVEQVEYPCNICVGWDPQPYKDNNGVDQTVPGNLQTMFPASQAGKPANVRWACKMVQQSGCYDMCSMDKAGKLTLVRTAIEMLASGEAKDMPKTCIRGQ